MAAQHPSRRTPALLRYIQKHARRVSGAADGQQLGADDWSEGKPSASGNSELFEELPEQPVPEAPGWGTPRLRQPERHQRAVRMVRQFNAEQFGSCTNIGECEAVCPKEIKLEVIARMNRDFIKASLG